MRIGGAATTQQHECICTEVFNAMLGSGLNKDRIAHKYLKRFIAQMHEAMAPGDVIKFFRDYVLMS